MPNFDPNRLLTGIASILTAGGTLTLGTNLFMQQAPATPKNLVCVFHTGGVHIPGSPMRFPSFTVEVRNTNAASALPIVRDIYNLLNDKWNLAGMQGRITCQVEPGGYFLDASDCPIYPLPFTLVSPDPR